MDLNDDVLCLILERVDSSVSLICAATVCRRWRRAIADAAFLRRFRSLHAPAVAGDYYNRPRLNGAAYDPVVFVPSSPPAVDASHFSLDFLPGGAEAWAIEDSRGSLLLMTPRQRPRIYPGFPGKLICEPLTRRYRKIPPPDFRLSYHFMAAFLVDGSVDEAGGCVGMSNFRLVCKLYPYYGASASFAVFCACGDGEAGSSWSERTVDHIIHKRCHTLGRAGGSWYFYTRGKILIILDGGTGEFSSSELPIVEDNWEYHICSSNIAVTDGSDGSLALYL